MWGLLEERRNIVASYYECFRKRIEEKDADRLHELADQIWRKLYYKELQDLPNLGQGASDFRSFDEVLLQAAGMGTNVSRFAYESTQSLRALGHGSAATRWRVSDVYEKVNRPIDVFDWKPAMKFGHLLLPCATAEISSQADKGVTRLCLPFLHVSDALDPEDAIASLCCLTWFLAFLLERDLVATARLCRVSHKMRITKEDGDLWFNKACKSGRIATAIKDNNNSVLYMYIGGGAVDHCL